MQATLTNYIFVVQKLLKIQPEYGDDDYKEAKTHTPSGDGKVLPRKSYIGGMEYITYRYTIF